MISNQGTQGKIHCTKHATQQGIAEAIDAAKSYVVAGWFGDSIVALLLFAYGPVTQFAPGLVATLCWRRATAPGVLAGLVVGITLNLVLAHWPELRPWPVHAGAYGLIANALVLVVVSFATRSRGEADAEWLATAAGRSRP